MEFEIGDGTGWRPDVLPVHARDNTDERSRSGKDVINFGFLIGNFWPIAFNKTYIVCARIQTQLPQPDCIKDPVGCDPSPVRPLLIKMFNGWVFRHLRHELSPLSQQGCGRQRSAPTGAMPRPEPGF
jgi:hypothetical protein